MPCAASSLTDGIVDPTKVHFQPVGSLVVTVLAPQFADRLVEISFVLVLVGLIVLLVLLAGVQVAPVVAFVFKF